MQEVLVDKVLFVERFEGRDARENLMGALDAANICRQSGKVNGYLRIIDSNGEIVWTQEDIY